MLLSTRGMAIVRSPFSPPIALGISSLKGYKETEQEKDTYKLNQVDDWSLSTFIILDFLEFIGSNQGPQFVQID